MKYYNKIKFYLIRTSIIFSVQDRRFESYLTYHYQEKIHTIRGVQRVGAGQSLFKYDPL